MALQENADMSLNVCLQPHRRQWSAKCSTLRFNFKKLTKLTLFTEFLPCYYAINEENKPK